LKSVGLVPIVVHGEGPDACNHDPAHRQVLVTGSTSADLDEEMLFYFRSRGVPEQEARALLIESFIGEAIAKVEREDVREALAALAREWLDTLPPAARA